MKFAAYTLLCFGFVSASPQSSVFAAETNATQSSEILALERRLASTRDELAEAKTALAIAKSQTEAAQARIQSLSQPDSEVSSLRSQIRVLERDLQSATTALKRLAAEKGTATANAPAPPAAAKPTTMDPQLAEARSLLAAARKELESRDAELSKLWIAINAAEGRPSAASGAASGGDRESLQRALQEAQQQVTTLSQEVTEARRQLAAARTLESQVRQLEAEKTAYLSQNPDSGGTKEELARVATAKADLERKLATAHDVNALLSKERDEYRAAGTKVAELEARIRQMESEKPVTAKAPAEAGGSDDALARITAAHAATESKLSTVLRSFTLLSKERDELRAQLTELTAKVAAAQEKR